MPLRGLRPHPDVVTKADFACPLLQDQALQEFLNNARGASAVAAKAKKDPEAVSRLGANTYQAQLSTTDAADLLAQAGSTAANLHPTNRNHLMALTRHAGAGAVEAGLRAAATVESSLQTLPVSDSFSGATQSSTVGDLCDLRRPPRTRKEIRRHQAVQLGRTRRHAAALSGILKTALSHRCNDWICVRHVHSLCSRQLSASHTHSNTLKQFKALSDLYPSSEHV